MDEKTIRNYALANAVKHDGKATVGSVVGSLIAADPEIKKQLKELSPKIAKIVQEVNSISLDEQNIEIRKNAPELIAEKPKLEEEKTLKQLKNAEQGKVVMRFEPSPSGPLHIGHAYVGSLNAEYCRMYEGKLIIRISDTNANNIYVPAYDQIPENADWLWRNEVKDIKLVVQSDRLEIYYEYTEKLLESESIYVCTCNPEEFKKLITDKKPCPCRTLGKEEQIKRWKKMLDKDGFKEGECVVRFKSNVEDKNPAMRDFPLLRINETEHPKQGNKYRVWPLMNFAVAVDDLTLGITHSIRGKDHMDNEKRQRMIFKALGEESKAPESLFVGRINFDGFEVSCSKTREKIERGEINGWDDIRIPFVPALKRRGYLAKAFMKYSIDVGVSQNDKTVHIEDFFKTLNSFNKDFLDAISSRFFFIEDPVGITIENAHDLSVELDLHPENEKGGRKFKTGDKFYITKDDLERIKKLKDGEMVRLMDCLNFTKQGEKFVYDSTNYKIYKGKGKMIIHWLPVDDKQFLKAEVMMPDTKIIKGFIETGVASKILVGEPCQLERFGFARLDAIDTAHNIYKFWFAHK